ncbi:MAG: hypothetical protein ACJAYR_000343 [Sneathiella sp.]|jgi:hypothetical protein
MKVLFFSTCIYLLASGVSWAEETLAQKEAIFTVVVENDSIGYKGTDQNYTSGIRLGYLDTDFEIPEIAHVVADFIPTFSLNEQTGLFYSLGQNLYTPSEITERPQDPEDRPWAAHLYASMGLVTVTGNHVDELELSLGIVGSAALGEQSQKFVHKYVTPSSPTPKGWSNQLKNEPALLLGWQRRYTDLLSTNFLGFKGSVSPHFGATLGNVYTFANAGFTVKLSPDDGISQDAPIRVRPGLPGTGYFDTPTDTWSWFLFAGVDGRAIARNIFLDGNSFTDSHSVDKKYFVADLNAGIAFTYDRYRLSYTAIYRTNEFDGQNDPSVFGALSFGVRF